MVMEVESVAVMEVEEVLVEEVEVTEVLLEVLPSPEPWGSRDQLCSSTPPPQRSISCCPRGCWEHRDTRPLHTHTALRSAPTHTHTHTHTHTLIGCDQTLTSEI